MAFYNFKSSAVVLRTKLLLRIHQLHHRHHLLKGSPIDSELLELHVGWDMETDLPNSHRHISEFSFLRNILFKAIFLKHVLILVKNETTRTFFFRF
ncbi:hypothetical protein DsansV1_C22g0170271 [Dioscorea sansibarensis]